MKSDEWMKRVIVTMGLLILAGAADKPTATRPLFVQPPPCYGCGAPKSIFGGGYKANDTGVTGEFIPQRTKTAPRPGMPHTGGTKD